ncbi:MAG: hypothetical protein WCO86_12650 [Planctomycetota bacterium]
MPETFHIFADTMHHIRIHFLIVSSTFYKTVNDSLLSACGNAMLPTEAGESGAWIAGTGATGIIENYPTALHVASHEGAAAINHMTRAEKH